jgi:hypothetical protein
MNLGNGQPCKSFVQSDEGSQAANAIQHSVIGEAVPLVIQIWEACTWRSSGDNDDNNNIRI